MESFIMKYSLRTPFLSFLLTLIGYSAIIANGANFDYANFALMSNPTNVAGLSFSDMLSAGLKGGAIRCTSDLASKTLYEAFDSSVKTGRSALRSWYKSIMTKFHGAQGFEVRELFGWKWVLERSVNTHISNVAKGARVVRVHVLEEPQKKEEVKAEKPYGIGALKYDIEYIVLELKARAIYYRTDYSKKASRNVMDRILDYAALGGISYLGLDWLFSGLTQRQLIEKKNRYMEEAEQFLDKISKLNFVEGMVKIDKDLPKGVREQLGGYQLGASVEAFKSTAELRNKMKQELEGQYNLAIENGANVSTKLNLLREVSKKTLIAKLAVKGAVGLLVVARLINWMRSHQAVALADTLSGINRTMVVHLADTLIGSLERLAQLCDQVKEESDIARLKDDFEFISKNCGETFIHIARIIDQDEAIRLQRLGKPGQAIANFGQGGGLGGGLPRF